MSHKPATVVMVPRERYSAIVDAIESLYAHTSRDLFDLIVVDGAMPPAVHREVADLAERYGFRFIHHDHPLTPNEARNIGLAETRTEFVVWSDNDLIFTDRWLDRLIDTAREFGAWLVGPTVLEGPDDQIVIHSAAGTSTFAKTPGKRHYFFLPDFDREPYDKARPDMQRGPTTMLEFHVMLARTSVFEHLGPLDEKLMAWFDHDDLTHLALEAGGPVIFEPDSIVRYHNPGREPGLLDATDLPYFFLRWSDAWADVSVDHVVPKWRIDADDSWPEHARHWVRSRRRNRYRETGLIGRIVGLLVYKLPARYGDAIDRWFTDRVTAELVAQRERHLYREGKPSDAAPVSRDRHDRSAPHAA